ncbi:MAG: serine/threonine protein kinase [Devosia sp.]|uniref:serine/threonine-protein kinase n=1 Tax=Devosia sp. TaxID=1871048 RepID=UPI0024C70B97|nr:serine/threonine-protein kinase [Devosia sp.]UYN99839.1 MAG: serine/threonine protein kinase [Devosia sp.]
MRRQNTLEPTQWSQVRQLLDDLSDLSPPEQHERLSALFLEPAVLAETRDLLAAMDGAQGFLPLFDANGEIKSDYQSLPQGTMLGPFRIAELIGRGGHGEVYRAERDDGQFEQSVAVKLLRPEALAQFDRFRAERQLLASLDHPAIARLIDGGVTQDGRPYMVMDFIDGEPVDAWCARTGAGLETRLRLIQEVAAAVGYAHGQLIVHGDIKPGNILVNRDGAAKLLDFGIARVLAAQDLAGRTTTALSTPAYAAPEQLIGARATTATDIYGLGAVLFELLTGRPAWQMADVPVSWASRILNDEPPLASTRCLLPAIPAQKLKGDLDAITARALRAEPEARYATVPAMSEDIERYLTHRPVQARHGNALYRTGRFLRRNALPVGMAAALVLALVAGSIGIGWNMQRAESNRVQARVEALRGESLRDFMAVLFRGIYAHRDEGVRDARQLLDVAAEQLEADAAAGRVDSQAVRALGELYFEVEEFSAATPFLEQFIGTANRTGDAALAAQTQRLLAAGALRRGDLEAADDFIAEATAFFDGNPGLYARERAELNAFRAAMLRERGERDSAIALLEESIAELKTWLGETSLDVLTLEQNLGVHYLSNGQRDRASVTLEHVMDMLRQTGRERSPVALASISALGQIAQLGGNVELAVDLYGQAVTVRKQIFPPSASLAALELNYARGLAGLGRFEEALPVFDEAIAVSETSGTANGAIHLVLLAQRSIAHASLGQVAEAEADAEAAIAGVAATFGEQSQYYGLALMARANVAVLKGDNGVAQSAIDAARPLFAAMGPSGQQYLDGLDMLQSLIDNNQP